MTTIFMKKTPEVRLADAVAAVAASLPGRRYSGTVDELWDPVKQAVEEQQQTEGKEARGEARKRKRTSRLSGWGLPSVPLPYFRRHWLGSGFSPLSPSAGTR